MRDLGEILLLVAFVSSGLAAVAWMLSAHRPGTGFRRIGLSAVLATAAALTLAVLVLGWALLTRDYRFAYVARYSSSQLTWYYALSALWVGQAGSLLLWAWSTAVLAVCLLVQSVRRSGRELAQLGLGILMGCLCFLLVVLIFAADPMTSSVVPPVEGAGLSPLLQHPAMLIHPPVIFLGYALWTVPFALSTAALLSGKLDSTWVQQARPWCVAGWAVLGGGILLGAYWAYEELGWGGYWAWDPVENGSLLPWMTGTALIHAMMAWQHRGVLKRTAVTLAFLTFGLCNFATFLTRSGMFSSLHAFSSSPIGWLFLVLMIAICVGGGVLVYYRRKALRSEYALGGVFSREALIVLSILALLLMTTATLFGTISGALSSWMARPAILLGPSYYNRVLQPLALVLLTTAALAPMTGWGGMPTAPRWQWRWQWRWAVVGVAIALSAGVYVGARSFSELAVFCLAGLIFATLILSLLKEARRQAPAAIGFGCWKVLRESRRQYAGYLIHLGLACLAIGVAAGSARGREQLLAMRVGQTREWEGWAIRLDHVNLEEQAGKLVAEAEVALHRDGRPVAVLRPAQHFHALSQQWTTEVAIHSTWSGDFYCILHSGQGEGDVRMTCRLNPMMRWLWLGGCTMALGALWRLYPGRARGNLNGAGTERAARRSQRAAPQRAAPRRAA